MSLIKEGAVGRRTTDISIGIPAYSRCSELIELVESIYVQTVLPAEVTICEDNSPERESLRSIVDEWRDRFAAAGCAINYHENDRNLGYDGNLRKVIACSHCSWVMLIGNDDLLLEQGVERAEQFIQANGTVNVISRSFVRFRNDVHEPIGVSRASSTDRIFTASNSSSKMIFRTSGFIGGLIVKREWAQSIATSRYDGTLFYQIYLSSVAFCGTGIGYIARPVVAARAGNPPLFGSATCEKDVHVPGSYTPKGRAKMWKSVIRITSEIGAEHGFELASGIRQELAVRSSFLVFEALAGSDRRKLSEMRQELKKLDLFAHPIPRTLFLMDWILGSKARSVYSLVRMVMQ
jgi:glycosyltransferase involved in cell wall biosynthesis